MNVRAIAAHPYVLLGLTAAIWGANAVAGKIAVGHVSPMMLTFLRWTIAVAVFAPYALPKARREWPTIRARLPYLFMLGFCGFTLFNTALYTALLYTSAVQVTIVQSAMPLVVFVGMFFLFQVRAQRLQIVGFMVTFVGVALTATRGDLSALLTLQLNFGDVLMLFALVLYGGYTVALRVKPKLHWASFMFVLAISAWISTIPFVVGEAVLGHTILPDATGWAVVVFTAIFPSIVSQVFYIRGIEQIGANRANLFINLVPIFGAAMAVTILGEPLLPYHLAALALVLGGITLAERAKRI